METVIARVSGHPTVRGRLTSLLENFIKLWDYPLLARRWARICLALCLLAPCLIRARIGLAGTQRFSHDAFMLLDGAWRMLNGQRPHIDFYSHLGILTYVPTVIGLLIAHNRAQGFGYAHGLMGLIIAAWTFVLGRRRLADVPLALTCLAAVIMTTDPSALGFPPLNVAPGMTYNRFGYALIALLLIEALRETRSASIRHEWWGGFSTGAVIACLFFLKVTYFVAALFLLVALIPCRAQQRTRWWGILTSFLLISILVCSYFRFDMLPMARDLITVAGAKHVHADFYVISDSLTECLSLFAFIVGAALLMLKWDVGRSRSILIAGLAVCIMESAQLVGNYEQTGFPMAAFLTILIIDEINARAPRYAAWPDFLHVSVLLLGSAFIVAFLCAGCLALGNGLVQKFYVAPHYSPLDGPVLYGFVPVEQDAVWYPDFVNEGFALLKRYRRPDETVMCLDFTNPFSYGLSAKPARGGTTVLQYGTTFDDTHRQTAQQLFGFADLVMLPKYYSDPSLRESIPRIYGPYLREHFSKVAEAPDWFVYRRNTP